VTQDGGDVRPLLLISLWVIQVSISHSTSEYCCPKQPYIRKEDQISSQRVLKQQTCDFVGHSGQDKLTNIILWQRPPRSTHRVPKRKVRARIILLTVKLKRGILH
jgi:hypothetical protein